MLTSRSEEVVARDELINLPRLAGLSSDEIVHVRMEADPFPSVNFDEYSEIILCGSPFDVAAPEDRKSQVQHDIERNLFALFDRLLDESFPFFGICYGLGLLAVHQGGRVGPEAAEEISAPQMTLTSAAAGDPLCEGVPDTFRAFVGHHEAVTAMPDSAVLIAQGPPIAPVQLIRVGESCWASQFHPELDHAGIDVRIREYADRGYYAPTERARIESETASADVSGAHLFLQNFARHFRRG